ncbi:UNVERIFIED_CONTAM: type 1 glutamine amidotransferase [Comamonas sp. A-3]|uniref:Glutamine amidotransferase class-I n=1 Tax=Comamonas testosteroni (strain DSM 14576 / KF-1) TaxID=399795 RepID=B7WTX5_COMTK|nr:MULTISPECIES: type 1 glutamine amidotransferase [Comamonas]EED69246.1 glutamine amidotransferase class-I [Comamonas testosteroni KF-1]MDN5502925.1 type 1 glutamine amidotransferase [Comamonas sp.]MDN5536350.1 type 1 glutamine amidotransferase [Comamonas sp.]WQG67228.1 type 1 glutamine amidotransferase [Comamonas testosteroni]
MKPVAIFQHTEVGAPGSIERILMRLGIPYERIAIVHGQAVPLDARHFSGLVFMGGYMSVHDDLPWIGKELALIQQAVALDIPVIGHCLGSQLLAAALGASVTKAKQSEIGWNSLQFHDSSAAKDWLGELAGQEALTFQWHGDTFSIPEGADHLASSAFCENQMFVLNGKHVGIQSHLEMTPGLVQLSVQRNGAQLQRQEELGNQACSPFADVLQQLEARTKLMEQTLSTIYARWSQGLVHTD